MSTHPRLVLLRPLRSLVELQHAKISVERSCARLRPRTAVARGGLLAYLSYLFASVRGSRGLGLAFYVLGRPSAHHACATALSRRNDGTPTLPGTLMQRLRHWSVPHAHPREAALPANQPATSPSVCTTQWRRSRLPQRDNCQSGASAMRQNMCMSTGANPRSSHRTPCASGQRQTDGQDNLVERHTARADKR